MNDEQKEKLEKIKKQATEDTVKVISDSEFMSVTFAKDLESRHQDMLDIKKAIEDLADVMQVNVEIPNLDPLLKKLEQLDKLPDSFTTIKDLSTKIQESLKEDKEVGIRGFSELWEVLVRQNNKSDKAYRESLIEFSNKFADLQTYLEQLNQTLKDGQNPEDFKPVRIVIGGDGSPLRFLANMPSRTGGGGGSGGGAVTIADGADVALGSTSDTVASSDTGTFSLIALVKRALQSLTTIAGGVGSTSKTLKTKTGSASATFTIVSAVASKKIKVYSLSLITASTTAVTVTFKDGAAGTVLATYPLQAITGTNFGITQNVAVPSSLFQTSAGTLLEMSFSAAQTVTYNLAYWDDDAS